MPGGMSAQGVSGRGWSVCNNLSATSFADGNNLIVFVLYKFF